MTPEKLRAVVNMLADPRSAPNAAQILAQEAQRQGLLVADLIAQANQPLPPQPAEPAFADTPDPIDISTARLIRNPYGVAIAYGLQTEILGQTDKAWLARMPNDAKAWLPKSQVEHHGLDPAGRAILVIPLWLGQKLKILAIR